MTQLIMSHFWIHSDNFLNQLVLQPTRGNNILDLILTDNNDMVCDITVGELISCRNIITFNAIVNPYYRKSSKQEFCNFKKADWTV